MAQNVGERAWTGSALGATHRHVERSRTAGQVRGWRQTSITQLRWLDAGAVVIALLAAQIWRFGTNLNSGEFHVYGVQIPYAVVGVAMGLLWWLWLELSGGHDVRLLSDSVASARHAIQASLAVFGVVAIASFAAMLDFGRGYILVALPLGILLLLAGRALLDANLRRKRRRGECVSTAMVLGSSVTADHVLNHLRRDDSLGLRVAAVIDASQEYAGGLRNSFGLPVLTGRGTPEAILSDLARVGADTLIVTDESGLSPTAIRRLGWALSERHIRLMLVPSITGIAGPRLHVRPVAGMPLVHVGTPRFSAGTRVLKRAFDIVVSSILITLLSPIFLTVSLLVKSDGGPVFFKQKRIGLNGVPFGVFKFRSMVPNAADLQEKLMQEAGTSALFFKVKDDPRITKHGGWLRRYSIDELPQLLNVFKGDMSLVGPRPQVEAEVREYDTDTSRRLLAKPGMTGLWQVSGRSNLSPQDAVQLDLFYVENWSLAFDIGILLKTLRAVIHGDGAY